MNPPLVELRDVSVVRDGNAILDKMSLTIHEGEHTAILGPNGCGKSTLIKLLTREIHPFAGAGSVTILGKRQWLQRDLRRIIGVISGEPKEPLLGDPSVLDVAVSGLLGTYGVVWGYDVSDEMWALGREALAKVEIGHLERRSIETLSAGEHRRVFIARALVSDPRALVLDEPTTSLDIKATSEFCHTMESIARGNKTLILVTHHIEEIISDIRRVVLMRRGKIVADGNPDEVLNDTNLSKTFDANVRIVSRSPFRAVLAQPASMAAS